MEAHKVLNYPAEKLIFLTHFSMLSENVPSVCVLVYVFDSFRFHLSVFRMKREWSKRPTRIDIKIQVWYKVYYVQSDLNAIE